MTIKYCVGNLNINLIFCVQLNSIHPLVQELVPPMATIQAGLDIHLAFPMSDTSSWV